MQKHYHAMVKARAMVKMKNIGKRYIHYNIFTIDSLYTVNSLLYYQQYMYTYAPVALHISGTVNFETIVRRSVCNRHFEAACTMTKLLLIT